jgi:hypothetical protein
MAEPENATPAPAYSNAVTAHPGAFDIVLDFGFQLGDASEPRETVARVAMSWEHAQAFKRMLSGLVDRYEQELGPLPDIEKARVTRDAGVGSDDDN